MKNKKEEEKEGQEVSFLCRCTVWNLPQDDDTSALRGPNLLSAWRHLDLRQLWGPISGESEDESRTLGGHVPRRHSPLTMSEMSSRSVLMLLILSRLARVWMDTYWSPSIWEMR